MALCDVCDKRPLLRELEQCACGFRACSTCERERGKHKCTFVVAVRCDFSLNDELTSLSVHEEAPLILQAGPSKGESKDAALQAEFLEQQRLSRGYTPRAGPPPPPRQQTFDVAAFFANMDPVVRSELYGKEVVNYDGKQVIMKDASTQTDSNIFQTLKAQRKRVPKYRVHWSNFMGPQAAREHTSPSPAPVLHTIFVGNLASDVTDISLWKAFRQYKSLQDAHVVRDKRTMKSKSFGFVTFTAALDYLKTFREMQGKYIGKHPVIIRKSEIKTVEQSRHTTLPRGHKRKRA